MGKANKRKPFNKEAAKAYGGGLKHFIKTISSFEEEAGPPTNEKQRSWPTPRKSTPDVVQSFFMFVSIHFTLYIEI